MRGAAIGTPEPEPTLRLCVAGVGNVGGAVLAILDERAADLRERYGVSLVVTAVADVVGAAIDPRGLPLPALRSALAAGLPPSSLSGVGRLGMTPVEMVESGAADILLEATPVNLRDGQPGLGAVRRALLGGMHVVLANKAPLALDYAGLAAVGDLGVERHRAGADTMPRLRFSATVAGALPVVNIGRRDLAGVRITRIEAVFNGTSQSILRAMESGADFTVALQDAQRRGIAEADPSLDVSGLDAACKLAIVANAVLGQPTTLADIAVTGIDKVDRAAVADAVSRGARIVPLCVAESDGAGYRLAVRPAELPGDHPLAGIGPDEMAVVFYADRVDRIVAVSLEPGPEPAAAAMVRDVLDIAADIARARPLGAAHAT